MFHNMSKVFRFTFFNYIKQKSYKTATVIFAVLLFAVPVAVFLIIGSIQKDEDETEREYRTEKVYVINHEVEDVNYNLMNMNGMYGDHALLYVNAASVEGALEEIEENGEDVSLVMEIYESNDRMYGRIILPDESSISEDEADHFDDYLDGSGYLFSVLASGTSVDDMTKVSAPVSSDQYSVSGYEKGTDLFSDQDALNEQNNEEILPVFQMFLILLSSLIIYMIIIFYGQGIMQSIVLEKSSKLMDTMLISVTPEAMIAGKFLGVLSAGILQLFLWIISLVAGVIGGVKLEEIFFGGRSIAIIEFVKSFKALHLFSVSGVILGIVTMVLGIVMYTAMAAFCGAISENRETVASNQGIFMMVVLISFYLVMFCGINSESAPLWLYIVPFTAAMILPSGAVTGLVTPLIGCISFVLLLVFTAAITIMAGRIYKIMALYKGNKINVFKAVKMLFKK